MSSRSIRRFAGALILLTGLGGCAFFPAYDTEHAAELARAGGQPSGNLVPALIAVGDKAAEAGNTDVAIRLYGRAASLEPGHPATATALERAAALIEEKRGRDTTPVPRKAVGSSEDRAYNRPYSFDHENTKAPPAGTRSDSDPAPANRVAQDSVQDPVRDPATDIEITVVDLIPKNNFSNILKNNNIHGIEKAAALDGSGGTPAVPTAGAKVTGEPATDVRESGRTANEAWPLAAETIGTGQAAQTTQVRTPSIAVPPALPAARTAAVRLAGAADADGEGTRAMAVSDLHSGVDNFAIENSFYNENHSVSDPSNIPAPRAPQEQEAAQNVPPMPSGTATSVPGNINVAVIPEIPGETNPPVAATEPVVATENATNAPAGTAATSESRTTGESRISGQISQQSGLVASSLAATEASLEEARSEQAPSSASSEEPAGVISPAAPSVIVDHDVPESGVDAGNRAGRPSPQDLPEKAFPERTIPDETAPEGTYQVQLAAYRSADLAVQGWNRIKAASQGALDIAKPVVIRAELPRVGTVYRLRIGGFQARYVAQAFCQSLKSRSIDCFVAESRSPTEIARHADEPRAAG